MQFACTLIVFCTWYSAKGRTECLGALWRCKVIKTGCHLLVPGNTGSGPTVLALLTCFETQRSWTNKRKTKQN